MTRFVCQFSCGAASAVSTKIVLYEHRQGYGQSSDQVLILNAFIKEEHPDNRRFLSDCERWFKFPITVLSDETHGASTDEVWRRQRWIKSLHGAPCSKILKRNLLSKMQLPGDVNVIGFTREESDRFENLCERFPLEHFRAPLIEHDLSKSDCLAIITDAKIEIPAMYKLGYENSNCIGCPKGGQNYWQAIREDFPDRFEAVKAIQEELGPGANFLQYRSGPKKGTRMPLSELPSGRGNMSKEASFSCSFFCEMYKSEII